MCTKFSTFSVHFPVHYCSFRYSTPERSLTREMNDHEETPQTSRPARWRYRHRQYSSHGVHGPSCLRGTLGHYQEEIARFSRGQLPVIFTRRNFAADSEKRADEARLSVL